MPQEYKYLFTAGNMCLKTYYNFKKSNGVRIGDKSSVNSPAAWNLGHMGYWWSMCMSGYFTI